MLALVGHLGLVVGTVTFVSSQKLSTASQAMASQWTDYYVQCHKVQGGKTPRVPKPASLWLTTLKVSSKLDPWQPGVRSTAPTMGKSDFFNDWTPPSEEEMIAHRAWMTTLASVSFPRMWKTLEEHSHSSCSAVARKRRRVLLGASAQPNESELTMSLLHFLGPVCTRFTPFNLTRFKELCDLHGEKFTGNLSLFIMAAMCNHPDFCHDLVGDNIHQIESVHPGHVAEILAGSIKRCLKKHSDRLMSTEPTVHNVPCLAHKSLDQPVGHLYGVATWLQKLGLIREGQGSDSDEGGDAEHYLIEGKTYL